MGDGEGEDKRRRRRRLTQARRDRFLEVLAQTGNRGMASEAIGLDARLMDQRRRYDRLLDRQWREALDRAHRRLAGIEGPYDPQAGEAPVVVVKRTSNGRIQLQKAGAKRWNFARRLEEALDDAEFEIEFRVAAEARGLGGGYGDSHFPRGGADPDPAAPESGCPGPLDMDSAMRFLKWREEKRRGGGRRGRVPKPPSIEQVTERIVQRVKAIRRHRARGGAPLRAEDGEGEGA